MNKILSAGNLIVLLASLVSLSLFSPWNISLSGLKAQILNAGIQQERIYIERVCEL